MGSSGLNLALTSPFPKVRSAIGQYREVEADPQAIGGLIQGMASPGIGWAVFVL